MKIERQWRATEAALLRAARDVPAEGGLAFQGPTTAKFRKDVVAAWKALPDPMRRFLEAHDFKLLGGRTMGEIEPAWMDENAWADGTPEGLRTNGRLGGYDYEENIAGVAQFGLKDPARPVREILPLSAREILRGRWASQREGPKNTVWHEIFHALDKGGENYLPVRLSKTPAFWEAIKADIRRQGGPKPAAKAYARFVTEDGQVASSELFAELGAVFADEKAERRKLLRDWPTVSAFMRRFTRDFVATYKGDDWALASALNWTMSEAPLLRPARKRGPRTRLDFSKK
jgi:hypothetical protein